MYLHLYVIRKCFLAGSELVSVSCHFNYRHMAYALAKRALVCLWARCWASGKSSFNLASLGIPSFKPNIQILTQTLIL